LIALGLTAREGRDITHQTKPGADGVPENFDRKHDAQTLLGRRLLCGMATLPEPFVPIHGIRVADAASGNASNQVG
jgi:hypothetical protein